MRLSSRTSLRLLLAGLLASSSSYADETRVFEAAVTKEGPDHLLIPFTVPADIEEILYEHQSLGETDVLDFGLLREGEFRGWGGGLKEPATLTKKEASRGYLPGPIAGNWSIVIGKAKLLTANPRYKVTITLRTKQTLPPQVRKPYVSSPPLKQEARFYAMDFHVHSRESGDASPDLETIAKFAESVGLDAVEISDHNTISHLDYFAEVQAKHPNLLFVPGIEYTTYAGHANAIGTTKWGDHKIGLQGLTIDTPLAAFRQGGALIAINHPALDLGTSCTGCAWKHANDPKNVDAVEISTGDIETIGSLFLRNSLLFWEDLARKGIHAAAIGGSDDHDGGAGDESKSVIGQPTTMVFAENLSVAALLDGIRKGKTVVKTHDVKDPMIVLSPNVAVDDRATIRAKSVVFSANIFPVPRLAKVRLVKNGEPIVERDLAQGDSSVQLFEAIAPGTGEDFYRVEVLVDAQRRAITSHMFLRGDEGGPDGISEAAGTLSGAGLGCANGNTSIVSRAAATSSEGGPVDLRNVLGLAGLGALVFALRRKRPSSER